jgi:hypothetical protein
LSATVRSLDDIIAKLETPDAISLDCTSLSRGIDNYHADVELSPGLIFKLRDTINLNLNRLLGGKGLISGNSVEMIAIRDAYTDLIKATLHRTKTDLQPDQVKVLQFAIVKFVLQQIRDALDAHGTQLEETLGQQQMSGARALLTTQERIRWYRKHSGELFFRLARHYLRQFQREENNQLRALREQMLTGLGEAPNILYNPLLFAPTPVEPILLLEYYALWTGSGLEFAQLNADVEAVFRQQLNSLPFDDLKPVGSPASVQSEVYDELGGLLAVQPLLGAAEDQKEIVSESFSWLDYPGNIRLLFDEKVHEKYMGVLGEQGGIVARWRLRRDVRKLQKIFRKIRRGIVTSGSFRAVFASYSLRDKLTQADLELIDIEAAVGYVSGTGSRRLSEIVNINQDGASGLQARLAEYAQDFRTLMKEADDRLFLKFLVDFSRYRLHLKYYRFAHRVFNRLAVITDPEKIRLARAGGGLYRLLSSSEAGEAELADEPEIVHHTILKADVRGSTTVTTELLKRNLNPASYFSLRFFDPINERLATYGAVKVFIEGDAVILAVYEYNNAPDQWFSVSRACGIAKEMIDIVISKNTNSSQTGLPQLEIGIGICYAGKKPLFLFDDDKPIMISSTIGDADRLSSCSWRLRKQFDPGHFNVAAFCFEDDDPHSGEKGQEVIRYNVNGIVIDDEAFEKLKAEVHFTKLEADSGSGEETFYVGQYPDIQGKERDLVVRQGRVGLMRNDRPDAGCDTGKAFFEVLPNTRYASRIIKLARRKS